MSRFAGTSLCCAALAIAAAAATSGAARWAVLLAIGAAYLALIGMGVAFIQLQCFTRAICRGSTTSGQVALTFDDGPDPSTTPALLDLLDELGVKATFFCIGKSVLKHPDIARRLVTEGHLVGNHSFGHHWWLNLSLSGYQRRQIELAQEAIASVTGVRPAYYRPPQGLTNPHLNKALRLVSSKLVGWDVRAFDQSAASAKTIVRRIVRRADSGSIILLHDGRTSPAALLQAVREIVLRLRDRGLTFVRLDCLLGDTRVSSGAGVCGLT